MRILERSGLGTWAIVGALAGLIGMGVMALALAGANQFLEMFP